MLLNSWKSIATSKMNEVIFLKYYIKKYVRFGCPSNPLPENWLEVIAKVRCGNKKPVEAMRELGISQSYYYRLYSNNLKM